METAGRLFQRLPWTPKASVWRRPVATMASNAPNSLPKMSLEGERMVAPAAERNKEVILQTLNEVVAEAGCQSPAVLEIASGTGQHVAHLAANMPAATFQPTEFSDTLHSIEAWCEGLTNVHKPISLDSSSEWKDLEEGSFDVVMVANLCHISPWECTVGLCKGAGRVLKPGGTLMVYGPFKKDGVCTTESNASFDASLRSQNPSWGYRDIADVSGEAIVSGLQFSKTIEMPANNFYLVFKKPPAATS